MVKKGGKVTREKKERKVTRETLGKATRETLVRKEKMEKTPMWLI